MHSFECWTNYLHLIGVYLLVHKMRLMLKKLPEKRDNMKTYLPFSDQFNVVNL